MKLEVGMFVRINKNIRKICLGIGKIINLAQDTIYVDMNNNLPISFQISEVTEASDNLIELIEQGDILEVAYDNKEYICKVVNVLGYKGVRINDCLSVSLECVDIKSIETKEQFKANSYKIGEKIYD